VNLYTSVYWTKRVAVVMAIIIFLCSGWKIFGFLQKSFTRINSTTTLIAEAGFSGVDKLTISPTFPTAPGFEPKEFINDTRKGNLDIDNGEIGTESDIQDYPLENEKTPVANIYQIQYRQIDLNARETPRRIAKGFNFKKEPELLSSTSQRWKEETKTLTIEGQYLTLEYDDSIVKNIEFPNFELTGYDLEGAAASYFKEALSERDIPIQLEDYEYSSEYVNYDKATNSYIPSPSDTSGQFRRLTAKRVYDNLTKPFAKTKTYAVYPYPHYQYTNNYIIIGKNQTKEVVSPEMIVEMKLFDWPINQENPQSKDNKEVQTYYIKKPAEAYAELQSTNKYLISAVEWESKTPIKPEQLVGVKQIHVRQIKMEYYEDTVNTSYIQPVYVFISEVVENEKHFELVYVVPAIILN
jgi:hypothetical protein